MSSDGKLAALRQQVENLQNFHTSICEQLERVSKENSTLTEDNNFIRKKNYSLQQEISNHHNEYTRIESELYQQGQEVEGLKKENEEYFKHKQEVEKKLKEETQAFEKDQVEWQMYESELIGQIKELQDMQQNEASQKKSEQSSFNDNDNPPLTPISGSVTLVKTSQQTIKDLERRVGELTTEIDNVERAHTNTVNINKNHITRIHHLENELSQVKQVNQVLMEESERYQLLLHEKTMGGEFVLNRIMQKKSNAKYTYIAEKETSRTNHDYDNLTQDDISVNLKSIAINLEDELKGSDHIDIEKLEDEIQLLKDSNKAMTLYIQKILNRIMEVKGFEEILSAEWPAKNEESSPALPTTGSFNLSNEPIKKKTGRRKTFSGFNFSISRKT